jgi:hypothetical protein
MKSKLLLTVTVNDVEYQDHGLLNSVFRKNILFPSSVSKSKMNLSLMSSSTDFQLDLFLGLENRKSDRPKLLDLSE